MHQQIIGQLDLDNINISDLEKEIVDESTFKTQNSVYKWEIIK